MRMAIIWLLFAILFATGPAPWGHQSFKRQGAAGGAHGAMASVKARAEEALDAGQPRDAAALLQGMVLGDASHLSKPVQNDFRRSSLTHVVAASGQNISLMLALALPVLGLLGLSLRSRLLVGVLLVAGYVPLAGGEAPIRRAAVMSLVLIAAQLRGSSADGWHALGVAGVVTLLADRSAAASLGWQLSFAAVAGMLALGRRLVRAFARTEIPGALGEALAMTVAATAATTPLIAWRVGKLSLLAIPANIVAGPAVAPAMWLGMIAATLGQFGKALAAPIAWLASVPAAAVLEVAHLAAAPSWSSLGWRPSGVLSACLVGLVLVCGLVRLPGRIPA